MTVEKHVPISKNYAASEFHVFFCVKEIIEKDRYPRLVSVFTELPLSLCLNLASNNSVKKK